MKAITLFEWLAFASNLIFLLLLTFERRSGWIFGGLAAAISMVLLADAQLYYESILNLYYIAVAIIAYRSWKEKREHLLVSRWNHKQLIRVVMVGMLVSVVLGKISQKFSPSDYPYADAFITVFSFIATFKEARKILSSWTWWFLLNLSAAWLYHKKGLDILGIQMLLFALLCISGYFRWYKSYKTR